MPITYPLPDVHTLSADEILTAFQTNAKAGITTAEANSRNSEFGLNVYRALKQKSIWRMLVGQFLSPIVYLLVFGAAVSVYFKDYMEAIAILVVILVNAIIGFLMELQARSSMNALKEMDVIKSKVIRNGKTHEIPSEQLTVGDVVVLEAGDVIPGDGRLIEAIQLQCDESSLTGESLPTEKNLAELPKETPLGDRLNMVFKGASVMNGKGKAVITGIAEHTQLGTITSLVATAKETKTPLDKKLAALSKKLIWLTLILTALFAISGIIEGKPWVMIIKTSIALAVAAFPEGLPIVATVALAYGMLLMAKRNAIVKKLSAVETLGSTNVILTDKTGTLTENKIYVDTFSFPQETLKVKIEKDKLQFVEGKVEKSEENFQHLRLIGALCNNAIAKHDDKKHKLLGDPIEIALIQLADASGDGADKLKAAHKRIAEMPFSSETKMMGTLHAGKGGHYTAAKGSVEHLLETCTQIQDGAAIKKMSPANKKAILAESERMAADGLRVLAFAYNEEGKASKDDFLKNLIYVGMIGFLDPPRMEIKAAIEQCRTAGIRIVMITGDHPLTALNIARKVGLVDESEQNFITGQDLPDSKSFSAAWKKKILATAVFARTTPKQKFDIADVYQQKGNIVAMTGDGVNDAPALKKADVGIAMGLRGTQVAKETASIVLKDDSFTSIAEAVAHGRTIFQNIQKFVIYLVSCNLSEIFIVTILGIMAPAATLVPLQILFLNMVTDVFPALALGVGGGDETVMKRPPRNPKKAIVTTKNWIAIVLYALAMSASVIAAVVYCKYALDGDDASTNNVAFLTLALAQLFHVFNMSSVKSRMLVNDITTNKFVWLAILVCIGLMVLVFVVPQMRTVLNLTSLSFHFWAAAVVASLFPLVAGQVVKAVRRRLSLS